ncbi:hypothetical protein CSAL01_09796 [Colletotrichum salicis]|uniref:Uncharacterized protein n=1 Tax=Colletotrichum salicis TaxID=1209931 RepID=A0A135UPJ1_9PEZI|nr:hypothetical protein CSAL01_09796 [Colletotrichum salicis]
MQLERKRDRWRRRLLGSKDRPLTAFSQSDEGSAPENVDMPNKLQQILETPDDVWAAAFQKFQESDGDLAKAYAKHLNPACDEGAAVFDIEFVESVVKKPHRKRDEKQWKVAFDGKSIHVRSQVEKMVKFVLWTDDAVKAAVSTQPYAALAWTAVSIFLPFVKAGTELHDTMLAGLEEINRMLVFWNISETSVCPFRSHEKKGFYGVFIEFHHQIIRYYPHATCHLSSPQRSRAWENLVGWNGWEADTKSINDLNQSCQSYLEIVQLQVSQDSMESQLVEIYNSRLALEDISQSLKEIQYRYEDQIERAPLDSLYGDFKGHKNTNPERVQGTYDWVLQDKRFHLWRDSQSSSLLWISAGPGYRKSVLSRALIDENLLRSSKRAFFEAENPSASSHIDGDEARLAISEEIDLFIEKNLPNLVGPLPKSDQEDIRECLKAMENRTYLWLRLVFQMIQEEPGVYGIKSDITGLFEHLPAEASDIYEKVLRRFYDEPKTKLLFQLMLASPRPLNLREADGALTVLSTSKTQWKSKKNFHDGC